MVWSGEEKIYIGVPKMYTHIYRYINIGVEFDSLLFISFRTVLQTAKLERKREEEEGREGGREGHERKIKKKNR